MVERYKPQGKHLFQKGQPRPEGAGRIKGKPNTMTVLIKDALMNAASGVGEPEPIFGKYDEEGRGVGFIIGWKATTKDGLEGYLRWLALTNSGAFAAMLSKILPTQLKLDTKTNVEVTVKSRYAGVDFSKLSLQEMQATYRDMITMTKALPPPPDNVLENGMVIEHEDHEDQEEEAAA